MGSPAPQPTIDTCNACGKLFPRVSLQLCQACSRIEEHRFDLVRSYLRDHDGASLAQIARDTGLSLADVRHLSGGGRLVEVTSGLDRCTCDDSGTRCRHCRARLASAFRDMEQTMQREQDERSAAEPSRGDHERTNYVRRIRRIGER